MSKNIVLTYTSLSQKIWNFICFPYRAFILDPNQSTKHLLCLRDERMDYVSKYIKGKVLDLGCGPGNMFIKFFAPDGLGVDFFQYEGLTPDQIIENPRKFSFADASFDTIALIANINHIPTSVFEDEFKEISRITKLGGRLVITRIGYIPSLLTHNVVKIQSKLSGHIHDMDSERGCEHDERYTVSVKEITDICLRNGFRFVECKSFWTEWWLNGLLVFEKIDLK